jgi:ribonuclease E
MPNTARGGGISRKIGSAGDRKRLKSIVGELKIADGMAVIVRTAGADRTKAEIKRDYEYLLRLWENVRETTLQSTAPTLVHEEGNLIKRSIRDLYDRDIEEVVIEGEDGYRLAKDFMKLLIPSHAKRVKRYAEEDISLFHRHKVESQMDAMHSPVVQLKSGGYIVINPTEALVSVDVNSGRATRERNIEATALKTNLEAADEVARQLRLRDLAGLIVIDFIDMEVGRNNTQVERRLKEAMRADRARIQLGRISPFGLLEMSRQRLRPSLLETSFESCLFCGGTGVRRSTESTALHVLRAIEEEGINRRDGEIVVHVPVAVALYILNQKRAALVSIEGRYGLSALIEGDESLIPPDFRIERAKKEGRASPRKAADAAAGEEDAEKPAKRRRRSRRRRRPEDEEREAATAAAEDGRESEEAETTEAGPDAAAEGDDGADSDRGRRRRRGKRGGRRKSRRTADRDVAETLDADAESEAVPEAGDAPPSDEAAVVPFPIPADDDTATPEAEATPGETEPEASESADAPPKRRRSSRAGQTRRRPARSRAKAKETEAGGGDDAPGAGDDAAAATAAEENADAPSPAAPDHPDEEPAPQPEVEEPPLAPAAEADAAPVAAVASADQAGDTGKTKTINVGTEDEAPARGGRRGWWQRPDGD